MFILSSLKPWFLMGVDFAGNKGQNLKIFGERAVLPVTHVKARNATKHPRKHQRTSATKNHPDQYGHCNKV